MKIPFLSLLLLLTACTPGRDGELPQRSEVAAPVAATPDDADQLFQHFNQYSDTP